MSTTAGAVERNIEISFDFVNQIFADPTLLEEIPQGATLVLLPDDDPSLTLENIELAIEAAQQGENVYLRHVPTVKAPH